MKTQTFAMIGALLGMGACDGTAQTDRLSDYIEEVEEDNEDLEDQIKEMEASLQQAQAKVSLEQAQAKSVHRQTAVVDSMVDQVKGLQWELCSHQSTLSSGGEIGAVRKGVSETGNRVGLEVRRFQAMDEVPLPDKFYAEVPVKVEVVGDYHTVARFFDELSRLPRPRAASSA